MDRVDVGGLRIAYERAGDGPPLVLLHGYVGDGPSHASSVEAPERINRELRAFLREAMGAA